MNVWLAVVGLVTRRPDVPFLWWETETVALRDRFFLCIIRPDASDCLAASRSVTLTTTSTANTTAR